MKTIIKSNKIIFPFLCFGLFSCLNTDLDEDTSSIIITDNLFETIDGFDAALTGAYNRLFPGNNTGFDSAGPIILCLGADDVYTESTQEIGDLERLNANSLNLEIGQMWTTLYAAINESNRILGMIELKKVKMNKEEALTNIEAQALFLRSLSYFYLVRWFGEIQLITNENSHRDDKVKQSSIAEVYDFIISDLERAIAILPDQHNQKGRPIKTTAQSLLSKVYLTGAGWPLENSAYYNKAAETAKLVIDSQNYQLEPDFNKLWENNYKWSNREAIFYLYGSFNNSSSLHIASRNNRNDELGWNSFSSHYSFYEDFPLGKRKKATFRTVFTDGSYFVAAGTQPYPQKYTDAGQTYDQNFRGEGFFPILRYADILLIYAEASAFANGTPTTEGLMYLNQIKRRSKGLPIDQESCLDYSNSMGLLAFEKAVIDERKWEFAFEADRWFDMVRKKQVVDVNRKMYPNVKEYNRLLPKPMNELIENILIQNEGY